MSSIRPLLRLAVAAASLASEGCHFFDPSLFEKAHDGGATADGGTGGPGSGGDAGMATDAGASSDLALPPADGGLSGPLCGRASPPTLCPRSYLFCDGFEDESGQSFSRWSRFFADNLSGDAPNLGTGITVDSTAACLGVHALHASTGGPNQEAIVLRDFDSWPNLLHVRFYLFIKQHAASSGLVEFRNGHGDFSSLFVDPPTGGGMTSRFGFESTFVKNLPTIGPEIALARNQWLCVELTMRFDASNGEVHLMVDGSPVGDLTGLPSASGVNPFDRMAIGPITEGGAGPLAVNELLFDEVAVSPNPIGCN